MDSLSVGYTVMVEEPQLNPAQQQAVDHTKGPMLVVAGAGTGKTHVITQRIAKLIASKAAKPEQILALTFTDKAAGEMLDRLDGLIGWQAYRVNVMTFHAFGQQILQRFGHHLDLPTRGEVIPDVGKVLLLKQHLWEIKLNYYGRAGNSIEFCQRVISYIEALQNADISVAGYQSYVESLMPDKQHEMDIAEAHDYLELYKLYESIKRRNRLVDYHDQISLPLQLLEARPNVTKQLQKQYKFVLVDEYQDTNRAQDQLLRLLVTPGGNIFAVGDDDQAIYGFRGARLDNILDFSSHFQVDHPLVLTENYRSTQQILDAAYRMIRHNDPERLEAKLGLDKQLKSTSQGAEPEFKPYSDVRAEHLAIAEAIKEQLAKAVMPDQIAVLASSHQVLRRLSRVLTGAGIPFQLVSSLNIFETREMLQLWHVLNWIGLTASDEAIMNLLHGPFVGWSTGQVRQLVDLAKQRLVSLEAALELKAEVDKPAQQLVEQLANWRARAQKLGVSQLAYELVFESGLGQDWAQQAQEVPRMVRVFEDLQLWLRQMQQYEQVAIDPNLAGYLENFPQPPEIESEDVTGDESGVSLLTVHAAKGLEFEVVYLAGTTGEAWGENPLGRGADLPEELTNQGLHLPPEHERRRLLYVAMTRAKRELIISAPVLTSDGRPRRSNPLLEEVFGQLPRLKPEAPNDDRLSRSLASLEQFAPQTMIWEGDRLPFESAGGWLELSVSDIERYNYCPYEFYLERVLGIRMPFGPPAVLGSLLHGLFRDYYQSRLEKRPLNLKQLQQRLAEQWTDRGYSSQDEADVSRRQAEQTLVSFFKREEAAGRVIRSSEEDFGIAIEEAKLKLKGRIDASFVIPEGIEVRDFKTGRLRDQERLDRDAKSSLQLRTYALAIQELEGEPPARVVLDYVVSGMEGTADLSATILKNHRSKLGDIADKIRQKQFAPPPDPFHNCASYRYWGSGDLDDA